MAACLVFLVGSGSGLAYQQTITLPDGMRATIDWGNDAVSATGVGVVPPTAVTPAQGRRLALRGAVVDAQRNLVEVLGGVRVTAESVMVDYLVSDTVRTEVEGVVQGAVIVEESWDAVAEEYTVVVAISLSGVRDIVLPAIPSPAPPPPPSDPAPAPAPTPPPEPRVPETPASTPVAIGTPTGLIFDVRGLDPVPSLTFKVFGASGVEVVSRGNGSYVIGSQQGSDAPIAEFGRDDRVADRPFMIRAVGLRPNGVDLVISDEDAGRLVAYLQERDYFVDGRTLVVTN
jgi:hypothetical protein